MPESPPVIDSKPPAVGTTIFTVISRLAAECGAINLSRGSRFELLPCRGSYFQLVRYTDVVDLPDRVARFCFAKQESTLAAAGEKLRRA